MTQTKERPKMGTGTTSEEFKYAWNVATYLALDVDLAWVGRYRNHEKARAMYEGAIANARQEGFTEADILYRHHVAATFAEVFARFPECFPDGYTLAIADSEADRLVDPYTDETLPDRAPS